MTLKHSNKAKWAKKQHTREHKDPAVNINIMSPDTLIMFFPNLD